MEQQKKEYNPFSQRLQDVDINTSYNPIQGVEKAPAMSLDAALSFAQSGDPDLSSHDFTSNLSCAQLFAENLSDPNLSTEEAAIINFYTQESPFYRLLNQRLRNSDRQVLKPYFPLLKLLITAIRKLTPVTQPVYRGVKANLFDKYQNLKGKKEIWWSFGSTTDSVDVLQNEAFLGKKGARTMFLINALNARDISPYSAIKSEREYILLPGSIFVVEGVLDTEVVVIQLKELLVPGMEILSQVTPVSPTKHSSVSPKNAPENIQNLLPVIQTEPGVRPSKQKDSGQYNDQVKSQGHQFPLSKSGSLPVTHNNIVWGTPEFTCNGCKTRFKFADKLARGKDHQGYGYGEKTYLSHDVLKICKKKYKTFILRSAQKCPVCNTTLHWIPETVKKNYP